MNVLRGVIITACAVHFRRAIRGPAALCVKDTIRTKRTSHARTRIFKCLVKPDNLFPDRFRLLAGLLCSLVGHDACVYRETPSLPHELLPLARSLTERACVYGETPLPAVAALAMAMAVGSLFSNRRSAATRSTSTWGGRDRRWGRIWGRIWGRMRGRMKV